MKILVGCEESQAVTIELRKLGHEAYSCDIQECSGGHSEYHFKMDVFKAIEGGLLTTQSGLTVFIGSWDMGIFFPDCTYLTCAAEWAFKDIQTKKMKPGTLIGKKRRDARAKAIDFFIKLSNSPINQIAIENPVGVISTAFRKPDQSIQPYDFGDNASKKTCLWLKNMKPLAPTAYIKPRTVNGKKRWANQTDSGQNKLGPSPDRAKLRSKTYPGIAKAMAQQWAGDRRK